MRQYHPAVRSAPGVDTQVATASGAQDPMMRGLVNGVFLSTAVWVAAGYLTLILR